MRESLQRGHAMAPSRKNRMPALFLGHGSPMNAIEEGAFRRGWREAARRIPRPKAVLCVSAHWETEGVRVTSSDRPGTIHDFSGFPPELYAIRYPAPGDPDLARRTTELLPDAKPALDPGRGLDHGAWSVLRAMYPDADIPVVQLSLDAGRTPQAHFDLAKGLAPLREKGVLVVGSGNIVHNLGLVAWDRPDGFDWADRIDAEVRRRIVAGDAAGLVAWETLGRDAPLAVPTLEHYLPLLYVLAVRGKGEAAAFFNEQAVMGSLSMTCVTIGG
jgi:4,5-DOPA dioxygenase extradiol